MNTKKWQFLIPAIVVVLIVVAAVGAIILYPAFSTRRPDYEPQNPNTSKDLYNIIFIHHSTGENWLADDNGGLGKALANTGGYFVSDTNYGWGTQTVEGSPIGDNTDIGHWWLWFRSPESRGFLATLYAEKEQHSPYTRSNSADSGENSIIIFKSCFPNSNFTGSPNASFPKISSNKLKGLPSDSEHHTLANAKGIYIDLLEYFRTQPDKLFIAVTPPPLTKGNTTPQAAANARAFSNWLKNDWLRDYTLKNVVIFDFYEVLTDGGKSNYLEFPAGPGDDHPSKEGNVKATKAFLSFLEKALSRWEDN